MRYAIGIRLVRALWALADRFNSWAGRLFVVVDRGGGEMHGSGGKKGFSERFKSKNKPPKAARERVPRQRERFAMITETDVETLLELPHVYWPLLTILRIESVRHHGRAFVLPIDALTTIKKLGRRNLRRALIRLEARGLISVCRRPSDPPIVKVMK